MRQGEYSKSEFTQGMVAIGCDTLEKLKSKVSELRIELKTNFQVRGRRAVGYL